MKVNKVTEKYEYTEEHFKDAINARESNISNIEQSNDHFLKQIEDIQHVIDENELKIILGVDIVQPKFKYESTDEWREYMVKMITEAIDKNKQNIADIKSKIEDNNKALVEEKARLKLIKEGIPAWEDETFNKNRK